MPKLTSAMIRRLKLNRINRSEIVKDLGKGANAAVKSAAKAEGCVYEWWNKGQVGKVAYRLREPVVGEQVRQTVQMTD